MLEGFKAPPIPPGAELTGATISLSDISEPPSKLMLRLNSTLMETQNMAECKAKTATNSRRPPSGPADEPTAPVAVGGRKPHRTFTQLSPDDPSTEI